MRSLGAGIAVAAALVAALLIVTLIEEPGPAGAPSPASTPVAGTEATPAPEGGPLAPPRPVEPAPPIERPEPGEPTRPEPPPVRPPEPPAPAPDRSFVLHLALAGGGPLAGAVVMGRTAHAPLGVGTSDRDGNVAFPRPEGGDENVTFEVHHPAIAGTAEVGPYPLAAGEATASLEPAGGGLLLVEARDRARGEPVEVAEIRIRPETAPTEFVLPIDRSASGEPGSVRLGEGTYHVELRVPGYSRSAPGSVAVLAGETTHWTALLDRTGGFRARVAGLAPGDVCRCELEGHTTDGDAPRVWRETVEAPVDAERVIRVEPVDAGAYRMRCAAAGDPALQSDWVTFAVPPGEVANAPDVALGRRVPQIQGFVRGDGGAPLAGATVRCGPTTVTTDETGAFRLFSLDPGFHRLFLSADGYADLVVEARVGAETLTMDQVLSRPGSVLGEVRHRDGQAAASVVVEIRDAIPPPRPEAPVRALTDASGRFFVGELPPGRYVLSLPGSPDAAPVEVDVRAGERVEAPALLVP